MHAIGRIAYDGSIPNIQASWVKLGAQGVQQLLRAGVNDLGGTLMDESISRAAGAAHGQGMEEDDFRAIVEPLGRTLAQRTTLYDEVAAPASAVTTTRCRAWPRWIVRGHGCRRRRCRRGGRARCRTT